MPRSLISEGKTTTEAIENGLKQLHVSKNMVDIKVLESEEKRSFFSILAPRIVKVELTVRQDQEKEEKTVTIKEVIPSKTEKVEKACSEEEKEEAKNIIDNFLKAFFAKVNPGTEYSIKAEGNTLLVNIEDDSLNYLIGYRGEVLNAFQTILTSILNRKMETRIRISLNIDNYREKREQTLKNLAQRIAQTVLKTGKSVTLEPMNAYERKIIHSALQYNNKLSTYSIGEEPHRKVVISLIK